MSKSAEAFRTISEVAEVLDTPAHVLRFWESRFSQIRPVKRAGGRRYYRPADVALLGGIKKLLHEDGLTIRGVQKMLREMGVRHVAAFGGSDGEATEEAAEALRLGADHWPMAPDPEPAAADEALVPDPDDAEPDLFHHRGPGRAAVTQQAAARAALEREMEARRTPAEPTPVDGHFDSPRDPGERIPAAALLRAMTMTRAAAHRDELRAIYTRLNAIYDRRRSAGH